jgi:hypothetical protein
MKISKKTLNYLFLTTPAKEVVNFNCNSILKYVHMPENNNFHERLVLHLKDNTIKFFYKKDNEWVDFTSFTFDQIIKSVTKTL